MLFREHQKPKLCSTMCSKFLAAFHSSTNTILLSAMFKKKCELPVRFWLINGCCEPKVWGCGGGIGGLIDNLKCGTCP